MVDSPPVVGPRDPDTETNIRWGRCDVLICPNCLVQTVVGSRCEDCAQVRTPPMFQASSGELGKAAAAAFGTALAWSVGGGRLLTAVGLALGWGLVFGLVVGRLPGVTLLVGRLSWRIRRS